MRNEGAFCKSEFRGAVGRILQDRRQSSDRAEENCSRQVPNYTTAMPLYEFRCQACEKESEVLVRSSDWKGTKCPHCGSVKLEKKLSVFASGSGQEEMPLPACSGNPSSCGRCQIN